MQAKGRVVALNARVSHERRRAFDVAIARRGITVQKAVEEAIDLWMSQNAPLRARKEVRLPLIESAHPGSVNVTREQIDDLVFG